LVAVGAVIIETLVLQQPPTRYRARRTVWDTIEKKRDAKQRCAGIAFSHLCFVSSFHLPISESGRSL
jgi:hypothetical protein